MKICTRCVLDETAIDIRFDHQGVCNYCTEFVESYTNELKFCDKDRSNKLDKFIKTVKSNKKKNDEYDCVVGVSGGLDSSWALVQAVKSGLKPLAVHMDNGWNSELAQNNISNLIEKLGIDLHTHVIEWNEYRDLMQCFFDADVLDIELLYDNAMIATNLETAAKFNIKYILTGANYATEGIKIPSNWNWLKNDAKNIKGIAKLRNVKIKTFPIIGTIGFLWHKIINRTKWIQFLNYFNYKKDNAMEELISNYGFKPYPYKHYESVFTRFYQGFILPEKFNVDKRKVHLSTLIMTNQITREDALKELERIPYPNSEDLEKDKVYFLKKMRWSNNELLEYLERPEKKHDEYPTEKFLWDIVFNIAKKIRRK